MPSDLQSETARANGAKSRGPKTPEGREKSSRNAIKHGFTSNSIMVLDSESPDRFHEILNDFYTTYQPAGAVEKDLVEEMVAARWRIRRMWSVETGLLNGEIHTQETKIESPDSGVHLAAAFRTLASTEPISERHPDATGMNFLFGLGGGIRWKVGPGAAVTLGYKFLHISNAFTTSFNPGVDDNVFYVGYSFLR